MEATKAGGLHLDTPEGLSAALGIYNDTLHEYGFKCKKLNTVLDVQRASPRSSSCTSNWSAS